jgi:uncharacterized repeat protein (TIGR01451 family)
MRRMSLYVAFSVFISFGLPTKSGAVDFAPAKSYPVGTLPSSVVTGDFNRDGKMDIAVANSGSGNLSILLGNGDGTFQAAQNFDSGMAQPSFLAVGDFNGDGKPDLAFSSSSSSGLFLGNGDGTFRTAISVAAAGGRLFALDVNLDGKLDLVIGASLLLGNGDGTFQAARDLGALPELAGDLNGDHKPDFAAAGTNGINLLFGNGDGTFQTSVLQAPANTTYGRLFAGDFNGDGNIDLVVQGSKLATPGCTELCIHVNVLDKYLGLGRGQFAAPNSLAFTVSGGIVQDFNGDGKSDLLFPAGNPGYCPCANGMLLLGPVFNYVPLQLSGNVAQGVAADFNGDGLPDLAFADNSNAVVVVFLNTGPASGADLGIIATGTTPQPLAVGLNLTYTANFLNEGPKDASGVTFTDTLPNGLRFISAVSGQGSCIQSQGIITCNIGALASGTGADATIIVTPTVSGTITNTMNVSALETDPAPANNSATQGTIVLPVFALALAKAGAGTGTVSSSPAGIDCGATCSADFVSGTTVTLSASPSANSQFRRWAGACAGTDPNACIVTLNSAQSVAATFDLAPDFSLSPSAGSLTATRGGQASEALNLPAQGGFSGTIALACSVSGPAPMPTCGITPASVNAGGSATLTIDARALAAGMTPQSGFDSPGGLFAAWLPLGVLGCLLTTGFDKKSRRLWVLCLMVLLVAILPTACGGGSNPPPPPVAQNYTVTATATSGAIQHSTAISVTVQ